MQIDLKRWERTRLDEKRAGQIGRIYEACFPPLERIPLAAMLDSVASGHELILTLEAGETILGFALLRWLVDLNMLFLEYIAVDPALQGQGYGGVMLQRVIEEAKTRPEILGIIFEIESPEDGSPAERALRLRRIRFYARYAAELIEDHGAYRMPDITGLGSMPMKLMWIPTQPGAEGYPMRDFRAWLVDFYQAVYGLGEEDPFFQQILLKLES